MKLCYFVSKDCDDVTWMKVLFFAASFGCRVAYNRVTALTDHTLKSLTLQSHRPYNRCGLKTTPQKKPGSVYVFVTVNSSLFKISGSNIRNYALKASLDTVKLHWNCMILPPGWSDLESPEGSASPVGILKVMEVSLPLFTPSLPLSAQRRADGLLRILFSISGPL